jgi:hypothetical protein
MSVVSFPGHSAKPNPAADAIANINDHSHLESLYCAGMVAVIVRSGGDVISAHRSYDAAFAALPETEPADPIQYSAADLLEILYGEEPE